MIMSDREVEVTLAIVLFLKASFFDGTLLRNTPV